eukprot:1685628-Prymnesium_polylepis.1
MAPREWKLSLIGPSNDDGAVLRRGTRCFLPDTISSGSRSATQQPPNASATVGAPTQCSGSDASDRPTRARPR